MDVSLPNTYLRTRTVDLPIAWRQQRMSVGSSAARTTATTIAARPRQMAGLRMLQIRRECDQGVWGRVGARLASKESGVLAQREVQGTLIDEGGREESTMCRRDLMYVSKEI